MKRTHTALWILVALFLATWVAAFSFRNELGRRSLETLLNLENKEIFAGSLRLETFQIHPNLRIQMGPLRGGIKQQAETVPFEITEIVSEGPITHYFSPEGLKLNFKGLRLGDSTRSGIRGTTQIRGGKESFLDLRAEVESVGLEELARFNPENLSGSIGEVKGEVTFRQDAAGNIRLSAKLKVEAPGGVLPSRFFEPLLPYLPQFAIRRDVRKLIGVRGLVHYRDALLEIHSVESDRVKLFLHVMVPEYNLDLNLNLEIRVDEKNALPELAALFGLLQTKAGG